ncbi:hypothetical protein PL371_09790 [Tenacibaculum maritimum]|nr:hypothetical protein [Tenacibaculum maritimum]MDB0612154.1 hypothetical protein [Tenacibaculum maritimum]
MAKGYSYTIYAKDFMSATVSKIAANTGKAFNKINNSYSDFQKKNATTGKSIDGLRARLEKFEKKGMLLFQ